MQINLPVSRKVTLKTSTNMHSGVDGCIVCDAVVHVMANVQQALLLFVNVMHSQLKKTRCWMTSRLMLRLD